MKDWNLNPNDPYYPEGNSGPRVLEELTARYVASMLSNLELQREIKEVDPRFTGGNFAEVIVLNAIEFAKETIKQLNKE